VTEKNPYAQFDEKSNPYAQFDAPAAKEAPAEPLPAVSGFEASKIGRALQGAAEPIYGAGQLASHLTGIGTDTMDRLNREREARYQASRLRAGIGPQDWDYMAGLGNILSPVNFIPGAAAGRVLGRATSLAGRLGEGALTGAGMGAMNPVNDTSNGDFTEKKLTQMGIGAGAGALAAPVSHITSQALAPEIEPGIRQMVQEGFEPTIGMTFGPHSVIRRAEEAVSKWPFAGGFIRGAEENALNSANRIVANRALRPVGLELPRNIPAGYDTAEVIADEIGHVYDQVHAHMTYQQDHVATRSWNAIQQLGEEVLPDAQQARLKQIIEQQLIKKPINYVSQHGQGIMDGKGVQKVHSVLAHLERGYRKSDDPDVQSLGELVGVLRNEFNNQLERQNPTQLQPGSYLNNRLLPAGTTINDVRRLADEGWAHYIRLRDATAATSSMGREGAFTPNTYAQSVRKGAGTTGQAAHGNALDQDLAVNMKRFLPAGLSDSGTTERAMWGALLGGGAMINPQMAAIGAMVPALYSRPVQGALRRAALAPRGPVLRAAGAAMPQVGTRVGTEGALSTTDTSPRPRFAPAGENFTARALARQYTGQ
jgi:hypothetical protein